MTPADDPLAGAAARSPRTVLHELAIRAKRGAARGRERPDVQVYLASGAVLAGRLVSVDDNRNGEVVMLHVGGVPQQPRVACVRVDQIVALVHDLGHDVAEVGPAPGRLEVARLWSAQAGALSEALDRAVELVLADGLDDAGRRATLAAAPLLGALLHALAIDELGRHALADLHSVRLGAGRSGAVTKSGTALAVDVPDAPDRAWGAVELRREVEKAL